mmetsp:Transcript_8519/g.20583  ORF Transcript_8519/g.20583 Transcript_8519/m.20583 type:complete len:225 (-) Transcript_8519:307-981(-)
MLTAIAIASLVRLIRGSQEEEEERQQQEPEQQTRNQDGEGIVGRSGDLRSSRQDRRSEIRPTERQSRPTIPRDRPMMSMSDFLAEDMELGHGHHRVDADKDIHLDVLMVHRRSKGRGKGKEPAAATEISGHAIPNDVRETSTSSVIFASGTSGGPEQTAELPIAAAERTSSRERRDPAACTLPNAAQSKGARRSGRRSRRGSLENYAAREGDRGTGKEEVLVVA